MLRIDYARGGVHHRLAHRVQTRTRLTTHSGRLVLRDHALARIVAIQNENDDQRVVTATIRVKRTEHVIKQVFESGRDYRGDAALSARQTLGNDHLRATQTVEEMRDGGGRFVNLRIEPNRVRVFPATRPHHKLEILSAADVCYQWTRRLTGLHVWFVGDFTSVSNHRKIRVRQPRS